MVFDLPIYYTSFCANASFVPVVLFTSRFFFDMKHTLQTRYQRSSRANVPIHSPLVSTKSAGSPYGAIKTNTAANDVAQASGLQYMLRKSLLHKHVLHIVTIIMQIATVLCWSSSSTLMVILQLY